MLRDKVFISYSHQDAEFLRQLETHLKVLEKHYDLEVWSDTRLKAGDRWREGIERGLARARVAVLLVSPDFLASDFIRNNELPPLLKAAAETDGVRVLWVPVHPSLVSRSPLADFQSAWSPKRPLSALRRAHRDDAWVNICEQILQASETAPQTSSVEPSRESASSNSQVRPKSRQRSTASRFNPANSTTAATEGLQPVCDPDGVILNTEALTADQVAQKRVRCPACGNTVFKRWPYGWDAHAEICNGLRDGDHEARKAEFKTRFRHLFR